MVDVCKDIVKTLENKFTMLFELPSYISLNKNRNMFLLSQIN